MGKLLFGVNDEQGFSSVVSLHHFIAWPRHGLLWMPTILDLTAFLMHLSQLKSSRITSFFLWTYKWPYGQAPIFLIVYQWSLVETYTVVIYESLVYSMCLTTTLYKVLDEACYIKMWYMTHLVITVFEHRSFMPLSRWKMTHVKSYTRQVSCYGLYYVVDSF